MGWEFVKLGDLVHRKIGYGIVQPGANVDVGVPIIKVNNIIFGLSNTIFLEKTTTEIDAKYARTRLVGGELVISLVGSVGKTAIVPKTFAGCNLVRATGLIDIKDEILAKWVKYYIDSPQGQAYINSNVNTTVQVTLNIKSLSDMPIPLPDHAIREKIVAILSSLDDKIELNRRINANLEQQAQALYKSWFVDFEPFGGKMPEDWKEGTLGEICTELKEKVHERDDVKVLSPVATGQLMLSEEFFTKQVYSKSIAKYIVVPQNCFAYNPARVNIGSLGMNEFDFDGCVSPVYVVFRCQNGYEYFFDLFRRTKPFKDEVKLRAIGGVRQTLGYDDFARIQVNIPTYNVVQDFNKIYLTNLDVRWHNQYEILRLAHLRDTLLPKLMSGEITV